MTILRTVAIFLVALKATAAQHCSTTSVPPVIDISPLYSGGLARKETVVAIGEACRQWGFFSVSNHGLPADVLSDFVQMMKLFFAMPLVEKKKVSRAVDNSRGYADDELTKQRRDLKEVFDCGHEPHPDLPATHELNVVMDGFNQWPASPPAFEAVVKRYYHAAGVVGEVLMGAIAESLGLPEDHFAADMKNHTSFLRLNHYPESMSAVLSSSDSVAGGGGVGGAPLSALGVGRHTDAGALTLLLQDAVAGLEVYSGTKEDAHDGEWVGVDPVQGALTINIGPLTNPLLPSS
jgi:isopenicillin N synthase-like dioxygenase